MLGMKRSEKKGGEGAAATVITSVGTRENYPLFSKVPLLTIRSSIEVIHFLSLSLSLSLSRQSSCPAPLFDSLPHFLLLSFNVIFLFLSFSYSTPILLHFFPF